MKREIMTRMMNMYIFSCREHPKEAEYRMRDGVGYLGGIWDITIYFLSIVYFFV